MYAKNNIKQATNTQTNKQTTKNKHTHKEAYFLKSRVNDKVTLSIFLLLR